MKNNARGALNSLVGKRLHFEYPFIYKNILFSFLSNNLTYHKIP